MVGNADPEYQAEADLALSAAMELYAYAAELFAKKRLDPHTDLMSALTSVEVEGERLSDLELELFFLMLTVAGNETTRNLMSGAMYAFFQHPAQWQRLLQDRSLLPTAVDEMLRFVSPVMNFRRTAMVDLTMSGTDMQPGTRSSSSMPRPTGTKRSSTIPTPSTSPGTPTRTSPSAVVDLTSASGPTWPAWRSGSCSSTCSTACPTSDRTARCSAYSPSSSMASSTSPWPSALPPAWAPERAR